MDNAEELIKAKIERLERAAAVKEPDRVPIGIATTYFPAKYAGVRSTGMEIMQSRP